YWLLLEEERYEYMIRYSALFDNDKQHRKKIDDQEILFDKISHAALEIKKFKRARENKIEFAYDYGNLNASYIIIDLEDEVVSLLEKEKVNLKTIESLKSKGFESSENAISESENQSEKECDQVENSKVIAPGMFKLNVKRYSQKDLLSCNNSHLGETSSAYVCNYAMNVSCNFRLCDSFDENNLFIFDDESVRISPISKMPFRKKPRDSMNLRSKSNSNKSLPRTMHRWLPKMKPLDEPIAKWIPKVERQIDKISKTPNSSGPIYK
nr:hypothetical protein [Tanacetum cinerariifolium]